MCYVAHISCFTQEKGANHNGGSRRTKLLKIAAILLTHVSLSGGRQKRKKRNMSVGLLKRRPTFFVIRANRRRAFLRVASRTYGSFHQISVERREFPTDEYPNHVRIFFLSIRDFSVSICGKDEVADETKDSDSTTHYRKNPTRFIYIFFRPF